MLRTLRSCLLLYWAEKELMTSQTPGSSSPRPARVVTSNFNNVKKDSCVQISYEMLPTDDAADRQVQRAIKPRPISGALPTVADILRYRPTARMRLLRPGA